MNKNLYIATDSFLENLHNAHPSITDTFLTQHTGFNIIRDTPEKFVSQNIKFLYFYPITDLYLFNQGELPSPPETVLNFIRKNKAKLIFLYPNEGNLFCREHLETLVKFLQNNNLSSRNTFIFTSNLDFKNLFTKYNFPSNLISVEELIYFEHNPWFLRKFIKSNENYMNEHKNTYISKLKNSYEKQKQYYFNSLNRVPRSHRVVLFSLMYEEETIKNKSIMSLGSPSIWNNPDISPESFRHYFNKNNLINIYDNFLKKNRTKWLYPGFVIDENLSNNQAANFNIDIYLKSYISIITETEVEQGILFFSEKIFKPIVAGHPFILLGNQNSLSKLKELGYKTFDKWWDESYDNHEDWKDRAYEVYKLTYSLSKMNERTLNLMIRDMYETLEHNIKVFFDNDREDKLYDRIFEIQNYTQKNKNLI